MRIESSSTRKAGTEGGLLFPPLQSFLCPQFFMLLTPSCHSSFYFEVLEFWLLPGCFLLILQDYSGFMRHFLLFLQGNFGFPGHLSCLPYMLCLSFRFYCLQMFFSTPFVQLYHKSLYAPLQYVYIYLNIYMLSFVTKMLFLCFVIHIVKMLQNPYIVSVVRLFQYSQVQV